MELLHQLQLETSRRAFLSQSSLGIGAMALGSLLNAREQDRTGIDGMAGMAWPTCTWLETAK